MVFGIEENSVIIDNATMNYVAFGSGQRPLVILPGLSDGLTTVRGQGIPLYFYYRQFAKDFRVYVFSRKNKLDSGYTTRKMARDQAIALERLGILQAHVMGVSQGGAIAQYLAIDSPLCVKKLVIGVSYTKPTSTLQSVVKDWIAMAEVGDYRALTIDTMEKTFTEKQLKKYRPFYPVISRIGKPKSFERFLIQAIACLEHDAYSELEKINCPTLVLGGDSDRVVGKGTSEAIIKKIKDSQLILYKGLGHGAYEEAPDFNQKVKEFLLSECTITDSVISPLL